MPADAAHGGSPQGAACGKPKCGRNAWAKRDAGSGCRRLVPRCAHMRSGRHPEWPGRPTPPVGAHPGATSSTQRACTYLISHLTQLINRTGRHHLFDGVARMAAPAPESGVLARRSARAQAWMSSWVQPRTSGGCGKPLLDRRAVLGCCGLQAAASIPFSSGRAQLGGPEASPGRRRRHPGYG
jgi:hypothetical protein